VMAAAEVPTTETMSVARPPCVLKVDGLAAGKGVFVCPDQESLAAALTEVARLDQPLLIEELLPGEELSVFALAAGRNAVPLAPARDYKRVGDDDTGPNTGGMGSYSPVAGFGPAEVEEIVEQVHRPVLAELDRRGSPFVGLLYAGLMLTAAGPKVLEFNCRFGDPETQSILPRLRGDLLEALAAAAAGELSGHVLVPEDTAAVTVALAGQDYPERPDSGTPIDGVAEAEAAGAIVFHAGTAMRAGRLVTNGGRILNVTALGDSVEEARQRAYEACELISFAGMRYRRDIAGRAVNVAT
jgi:phosphoribosylamine---glycine ligase